jgi:hypothetical protein
MESLLCLWLALAAQTLPDPSAAPPGPAPPDVLTPEQRQELVNRYQDGGPGQTERRAALDTARGFFQAVADHQLRRVLSLMTGPFYIEGQYFNSAEAAQDAWTRILQARADVEFRLEGLELLTPAEMETRYGKPPQRLASLPWKGPHTYIAVANLSGHPAVLVLRAPTSGAAQLLAFTD